MKCTILTVGRERPHPLNDLEAEYIQRLKSQCAVTLLAVKGVAAQGPEEEQRVKEGRQLIEKIPAGSFVIALDESGKQASSRDFARLLEKQRLGGKSNFTCIIGGPYGLSPEVRARADYLLSLSPMTFTARIARFILLEQLYRAITILHGLPYHKE